MKQSVYVKKLVSEGLPEKKGWYDTDLGPLRYYTALKNWSDGDSMKKPKFWYKPEGEKHVLSDEELETEKVKAKLELIQELYDMKAFSTREGPYEMEEEFKKYLTTKQDK